MDFREHSEYDHTGEGGNEEMQIEAAPNPETTPSGEIEMQMLESSGSFDGIGALDTQHTPMNVSVPAPPSGDFTSTLSHGMLLPILQRTGVRRSRVEDDHDDERDRRHPSERLGSPSRSAGTIRQSNPPPSVHFTLPPISPHPPEPTASGAPRSPPSGNFRLNPFHFFRHILPRGTPNSNDTNQAPSNSSLPSQANSLQQGGAAVGPSSGSTSAPITAVVPPVASDDGRRQPPSPRSNVRHQYLGGFTITIDVNGDMTTTPLPGTPPPPTSPNVNVAQGRTLPPSGPIPGATLAPNTQTSQETTVPAASHQEAPTSQRFRTQPRGPQAPGDTRAPPNNTQDGAPAFADILARIGLLAALSFHDSALFERDVDDPERAKKLVSGLEDVPAGLIKRLERVGKTNMGNEQEQTESGLGDGGCAICWERLLLEAEEPKQGHITVKEREKTPEQADGAPSNSQDSPSPHTQLDSGLSSSTSRPDPSIDDSEKAKGYQRIVTLPCAHVFHAGCLIPWFSKPKQTTCPICRFNIDPENLTYTSRAQRGTAHSQTQQQGDGGNGADATTGTLANDENHANPGVGIGIPLMFAGSDEGPPIIIPLGGGPIDPNAPLQPGVPTPTNAPAPTGDAENTGANADANLDRPPNSDIVTIGFDMYIGHGPSPFPLGGPNVFQIPVPGRPSGGNNTTPPPLPTNTPNPTAGAPTNTTGSNAADATGRQGNGLAEYADFSTGAGNTRGPSGPTNAVPIPMGPGLGRALGDMLTRIISGNVPTGGNATSVGGQTGQGGPAQNQTRQQGPIPLGPERPPTMPPSGIHIPGGVGFGFGGRSGLGGTGIQNMPLPPFVLPFGNRSGTIGAGGGTQQSTGGLGGSGGIGAQPAMGVGAGPLPIFDIVSGLFGGPPSSGQNQAQRAPTAPNAQPSGTGPAQPAQPRPRRAQDAQQGPDGFGFSWFPTGSPPPRPASAPTPRQQVPRRKWTPPPPPGLTLRQRVEKREQEAGLRCCDVSCGVGPSDEDPWIHATEHGLKQLSIRASPSPSVAGKMMAVDSGVGFNLVEGESERVSNDVDVRKELERMSVCPHTFHSSCLVSSERVALALRDAEVTFVGPEGEKKVEVSCPVCRGLGTVSKEEWDAGVEALE